jgi:PKD repeat protein
MIRRLRLEVASTICVAAVALSSLAQAGAARAEVGEIGQVGGFGPSLGHFTYPTDLAVDTENNNAYVLDEPGGERPGKGPASFRVQMFKPPLSADEAPAGHVEIATPPDGEDLRLVTDIAVDPTLHRLYVLEATKTSREGYDEYVGLQIDAYSTEPEPVSGVLPPAPKVETEGQPGVFYKFPEMPAPPAPPPAGTLRDPSGIAVEPMTHDLILNGRDGAGNTDIERLTTTPPEYSTGTLSGAFDDVNAEVVKHRNDASGIAVGPGEGEIYVIAHNLTAKTPGELPGIAKLTTTGGSYTLENPGISLIVKNGQAEHPLTGGLQSSGESGTGEQVAVSPDGKTVYAAEVVTPEANIAGSYEIRGMSTASGVQQVAFGGGSATCLIASEYIAVAAGKGGIVYALDEGNWLSGENGIEPTSYGFHLIEFGPGGSECPPPTASFAINGEGGSTTATIKKGESVTFDASGSQLNGEEPVELEWDFEGTGEFATKITGEPAGLVTTHQYLKAGLYTVGLKLFLLEDALYGSHNPTPVVRKVEVTAPPPVAHFEVSTSSPKPGENVKFDGSNSLDPAGLCSSEGCTETHELESYEWRFGNGETATGEKYERSFANSGTQARPEVVELVVTNKEGVKSEPSEEILTIQGVPAQQKEPAKEQIKEPVKEVPIVKAPVGIVTPVKKPLTNAQKLAAALKVCGKITHRKKRVACEKQARQKYGARPRKKKHGKKK